MYAPLTAMLDALGRTTTNRLALYLFLLTFPPVFFYLSFAPCVDCWDFESIATAMSRVDVRTVRPR